MGSFHNSVTTFFLLICGVGLIIFLFFIFDSATFPLPILQKPLPQVYKGLFPTTAQLLDLPHFQYIINNDVCLSDDAIFAVIIITSRAGDIEARSAMRRAYPAEHLKQMGIRRVFLLAVSSSKDDIRYNSVSQNALEDENRRYSDLVQGNFKEAYRNLTYKHVMGLQWATTYCHQAQYIIKMDDDIVVDFYRLINVINSIAQNQIPLLMGYLLKDTMPVREPASKWFVTQTEYSESKYPPFLSGWLYITTPRDANILVKASKTVRYFWIDDTYVTGFLAKAVGFSHQDIHQYFTLHPEYLECCIRDKIHLCDYIIGPNGGDPALLLKFQKHAYNCQERNCPQRSPYRALNRTCVTSKKVKAPRRGFGEVKPIQIF
ncbi:beta-1,3-galactosyltransferase 5 [Periplaneta americana]|uniref:beta-1,3-galactosyltransferase 5 n=1 Tax=Periplaneta americana TaxID=6978 RepID=UPI0037E8B143